jgi:GNAT superfamily N-acetyltransferase
MSDGYDYVAHRVRHLLWTEDTSRGPSTFLSEDAYRNGGQLWLESDYHQWGEMPYPSESLSLHWRGRPDYENLRHIYDAFGLKFPEVKKNPKAMRNPEDCPPATQDVELNTKNRNKAIQADYIRYGPLNLSDLKYYEDAAAHWKTTVETAKKSKCSNCVAFDISPRMLDCMPGPVSEPIEDEDGYLGYCWMHHFKCHSARTCFTWAAGGPISKDKVSHEWQERAFGAKNPKTPGGKTFPKRYLTGLNKEERAIAMKEIDQGYKYDTKDPKAYEYWKSDIKATARGYKTVPSKYKKKFIEMYGPMPEKGDFITKVSKATKIKKSIIQKVYDKGLAAWRVGHRPGVQQHQWAAGRVYSFVTLGNTVKKGKRKMGDYKLAVEAGLVKDNPSKISHYPDPESPADMQRIDLHEEGKNIGFLLWYRKDGKTWIHYVNVSKDHRGKDLGRLLINELLSKTKGEEIHLHAPIGTPREHLVQWYESMGFELVEEGTNEMVLQNSKEPSADDFFPGNTSVAHPSLISPTISITSLQNPNEWRHGAFAEDDPFEEYF